MHFNSLIPDKNAYDVELLMLHYALATEDGLAEIERVVPEVIEKFLPLYENATKEWKPEVLRAAKELYAERSGDFQASSLFCKIKGNNSSAVHQASKPSSPYHSDWIPFAHALQELIDEGLITAGYGINYFKIA